jgi:hypothetical protein
MKKFLTLVLVMISVQLFAQTNPITAINITLPANPDANTANWGTGTSLFMISATAHSATGRIDPAIEESRILVIIKKDGAKICGRYTSSSAPASNFNTLTKVWSGTNAASFLGQDCKLPPGDYELSVQFFGYSSAKTVPLSDEKIKPFTIKGNEQQAYQPPQGIAPATGSAISETDIKKPIIFRWTPVIPRPQDPVTYRLSVWQLMQGQNGAQAMRVNQPIITKDVDNLTQVIITNLITGPCKPPYRCDFVWNVQALNREGKPIGGNNGTSELSNFSFSAGSETAPVITLVAPANGSTIPAGSKPQFVWANDKGNTVTYKLKIVEITGDQSPENAFRTNKPFFEKDSLEELKFQYPPSAPAFKDGAKYGWAVEANGRWSTIWILIPDKGRVPGCKDFKVNIISNSRDKGGACCFAVSITNNYSGQAANGPYSFRINTHNTIISASAAGSGWGRAPISIPPVTKAITWKKATGFLPGGQSNLGSICFENTKDIPFYVVYEWLNKAGRIICRDSVKLTCGTPVTTACCKYALYLTNNQSASLFNQIKITPVGTTKITSASSDEDTWVQANDANYNYVTLTNPQNGSVPLMPTEEENIWFSIDPASTGAPKVKVEWIGSSGSVIASQIISLPCYPESSIDDDNIDWDSFTQVATGNQYQVSSGIGQVPCSGPETRSSEDDCPEINYALSCDGNNNTVLTVTRSSTSNPFFAWKVDNNSPTSTEPLVISPAGSNTYHILLTQYAHVPASNGSDSTVESCTNSKDIQINMPNPNFITLQIGQPCPDFKIKFIYTDGVFDLFQPSDWTYQWTFKLNGAVKGTSTDQNPTMTFTDPGNYEVTIVVTTGWGCKFTSTGHTELSYACKANLDWGYSWCMDKTISPTQTYTTNVTFQNTSTGGKCPTFQINFGSGYVTFTNGMTHAFTGVPGASFPVKVRMYDVSSGTSTVCDSTSKTIIIKPLLVDFTYNTCPNGDVICNTTSPNPTWEFPGANNEFLFTLAHKHDNTVTPNYSPGGHTIYLTAYDPLTHASCKISKQFKTIDICCDEQKSLQPFTFAVNGHNYKIRGKFAVKYKHVFNWSGVWVLNKHTKVIVKTLAFKEKTKKNGKKRWKRFKPDAIYAGVDGVFYNRGDACDCDNPNHYVGGDGSWDWWVRGVRFTHNIYDNGTNYIRWNSAKSVHSITVEGVATERNILLGQLGCTQ